MLTNGLTILTALLPLLSVASAAHAAPRHRRHHDLAARDEPSPRDIAQVAPRANAGHAEAKRAIRRVVKKRGAQQQCRARGSSAPSVAAQDASSADSSAAAASSAVASAPAPAPSSAAPSETPAIPNQNAWADQSAQSSQAPAPSPSPAPAAPSPSPAPSSAGINIGGIISINDGTCGYSNAGPDAPNGAEEWLNCGITSGGWTPPHLGLDNLKVESLHADGVFAPCAPYFWAFEQYGNAHGIPPILLASFAMQESTCNPSVTGGNGEAGLMQLTHANCDGAPGGNCYDVNFNVGRAAKLFKDLVDANGGNVLTAAGGYNGWRLGMTSDDAQAARWQGNCRAQNNLDYLHQLFNGWCQGKEGYGMGSWFNLKDC